MRYLLAFLWRDFHTEISYRFSFLTSLGGVLFTTFVFFFLSEFIGDRAVPFLQQYQGDYFSFALIGLALGGYLGVGLTGFARALRQSQTTGTLEALLMTPTPLPLIIVGSATWSYTFTTFRVGVYVLVGLLLLGLDLSGANYAAALLCLLLAVVAFASMGIIAASAIMVIKRGDPVTAVFGSLANLVGGVYYPVEILPDWLQTVANLLPITHALRAMRLALLADASWGELAPSMTTLTLFGLVLFPLSLVCFRFAVERARADGSLTHY